MTELFGSMRSVLHRRYALIAPEGFAAARLAGWENATCAVVASPEMGARFVQMVVTMTAAGKGVGNTGRNEYFFYLVEGVGGLMVDNRKHRLEPGSFAYLPADKDLEFTASGEGARVLIFQKRFVPLSGGAKPGVLISHEREVKSQPVNGHDGVRRQVLLPDEPMFDLAVNVMTYVPGATSPNVETHIMENGILMLKGQGIYRLGTDWHPVKAGDALWVAPYCPHWFAAVGKEPATYIAYKDVNRDPI